MKKILWLLGIVAVILIGYILIYPLCCAEPATQSTTEPSPPALPLAETPADDSGTTRQECPQDRPACPEGQPLFCRYGQWVCGGEATPAKTTQPAPAPISFSGMVLAGSKALVIDYNQADFDKALANKKLVVLYFYANWCPVCREEVPKMYEAFNSLEAEDVVAFRVNYNDNETDDNEKALARAHGVAYQHTKVFLKNGERILKSPESWDKDRYLTEINNALK